MKKRANDFFDPKQPFRRNWHADLAVLCSRHYNPCHSAYLYLINFDFNELVRE